MGRMSELAIELNEIGELFDQLGERIDALPINSLVRQSAAMRLSQALEILEDEVNLPSTEW